MTERLAVRWPWAGNPSHPLDRALTHLDGAVDAETVDRAARVVGTSVAAVALTLGAVLAVRGVAPIAVAVAAIGAALGVAVPAFVDRSLRFLATLSRTRALGAAGALVSRAALSMRIEPTVERAATFAARTGSGPLARSLARHGRRAVGTPRRGFDGFVAEWGDWFPALERAGARLDAAAAAPADDRDSHLDRAVTAVLDGARDELAAFTTDVRGPVTGLYAFGVLLPLALVGMLPAARATGVRVSLPVVVALYDVMLPLAVGGVGAWILVRRPVAFPPPCIGRDHPDAFGGPLGSVASGVVAAGSGAVVAARVVGIWAVPIAAVGLGFGAGLVVRYRAAVDVRRRVLAVETDIHDALYLVGRRVEDGEAAEVALETAADQVAAPLGDVIADAVARQRRLGVTVSESFCGPRGALAALPSRRAREMASLFALAATEGSPAGGALVTMAEHVERLQRIEREARRELARVTDTLANTATVFGPLVGGATVALSARIARTGTDARFGAGALPTADLGLAVGAYVLWLAAVLTVLATGLTRGLDRSLVGYRVGVALCLATTCYFAAYVCAGLFL